MQCCQHLAWLMQKPMHIHIPYTYILILYTHIPSSSSRSFFVWRSYSSFLFFSRSWKPDFPPVIFPHWCRTHSSLVSQPSSWIMIHEHTSRLAATHVTLGSNARHAKSKRQPQATEHAWLVHACSCLQYASVPRDLNTHTHDSGPADTLSRYFSACDSCSMISPLRCFSLSARFCAIVCVCVCQCISSVYSRAHKVRGSSDTHPHRQTDRQTDTQHTQCTRLTI